MTIQGVEGEGLFKNERHCPGLIDRGETNTDNFLCEMFPGLVDHSFHVVHVSVQAHPVRPIHMAGIVDSHSEHDNRALVSPSNLGLCKETLADILRGFTVYSEIVDEA